MIGGDGSLRGAMRIAAVIEERGARIAVVGVPKTIDNDIPYLDQSFGFQTAFARAAESIHAVTVEAKSTSHGIGLVKLMSRHSGFIACYAALARNDADVVLIPLGFDTEQRTIVDATGTQRCPNQQLAGCNWLVRDVGSLCTSCRLTRTRPADSDAESDDPHREQVRLDMGEPYRTMLGHLRHETGHYYWPVLVEQTGRLAGFRELFGDERADYGEAMARHYEQGAPTGWESQHVSAYATMHRWEDWAETFAHYLHIRDTLQTAAAFGIRIDRRDRTLSVSPTVEMNGASFESILADWLPLSYALNAVNRSMGRDDLYPFVLSPAVIDRLAWVRTASGSAA